MSRIKTALNLSVSKEDKAFVKKKAHELGYKTVTAFMMDSAKNHFKIEVDMKVYREVARELNYIGKNINSLVRRINTDGIYTDNDIEFLQSNQKIITDLMNKEYGRLLNLKEKYASDRMTLKEKENLINALNKNDIEVPKKVVLEEVYNQIKDDMIYLGEAIEKSPEHDYEVADYLWQYLYGDTLFELEEDKLISFANEVFMFTQKIKFKLLHPANIFNDDDWDKLKEILDEYEVY